MIMDEKMETIIREVKEYKDKNREYIDKIKGILIDSRNLIIVCGPTCVGKTKLSIFISALFDTGIISADSIQLYRGMDIGTDKYNTEKYSVKQYMIDMYDPDEKVDVVDYRNKCRDIIENKFFKSGKIPVLAGGSGLYIKSVTDDLKFNSITDRKVRESVQERIDKYGIDKSFKKLKEIDPVYASKININDKKRILRALEVYEITNNPFSSFQNEWKKNKNFYNNIFIGLESKKENLYPKIDKRVESMFKKGFIAEVKGLISKGYSECLSLNQAVGYNEVISYIKGDISLDECKAKIKRNTKKLVKKQMTWFRADKRINWITVDNYDSILDLVKVAITKIIDKYE